MESSDALPENKDEEDTEVNETVNQKAEKVESEKKKKSDKGQHPEGKNECLVIFMSDLFILKSI